MPSPDLVATLIVNGVKFEDWNTVMVQMRWADAFHIFRFTATEKQLPPDFKTVQFKPGDSCTILLAGQLAITGLISVRQVAYDAEAHSVELVGKNWPWLVSKSSIKPEKANYDGYNLEQITRSVCGECGVGVKVIGSINGKPFEQAQAEPGELRIDFIERLAQDKGVVVGSDKEGNQLLIGDHTAPVQDAVIEGKNILRASCIFSNEYVMQRYIVVGQKWGNDGDWGDSPAQQRAEAGGSDPNSTDSVHPMTQPSDLGDVYNKAWHTARWMEGTQIIATITVPGWLRRDGSLWEPGQNVWVQSPMLMLDTPLKLRTATFKQEETEQGTGTVTDLELVVPWLLNGLEDLSGGNLPSFLQRPPDNPQIMPPVQTFE